MSRNFGGGEGLQRLVVEVFHPTSNAPMLVDILDVGRIHDPIFGKPPFVTTAAVLLLAHRLEIRFRMTLRGLNK